MPVPVIAAGLLFACTPVLVYDGDGPVTCAEGPRLRLAGIAARERDDSCRSGQPCPAASGMAAASALVELLGGSRGAVRYHGSPFAHYRVAAPTMRCLSMGPAKGNRTGASCTMADGRNLSCAMLATGTVLRWNRFWPANLRCPRRKP